ncbi:MAG: sulfide/dihydroorotate dehydrogenase-like FAD/NAD-binding protein [Endomicrobiales bacterium]
MYTILAKDMLADRIHRIEVLAPDIAKKAEAGQFVIVRVSEKGERIPLTVAACDPENGSITLIFQEIGKTTRLLGMRGPGERVKDILGPLGHATEPVRGGTVVAIGGGVGAAEILPVSRMYRKNGSRVIGIVGARSKEMVILEKEMAAACDTLLVTTDDGSHTRKGFVTDVLRELLEQGTAVDLVYAIGPVPMMRAVANLTRPAGTRSIVSLNPIMVDGTGMCGACRVTVGGETKFACVDGPEFDGHAVDWEELILRLSVHSRKEKTALERYQRECLCNHQG